LCQTCQNFSVKLGQGGQLSDVESCETLKLYEGHIDLTKKQRQHYREQCQESKATFLEVQTGGKGNKINSRKRGVIEVYQL